MKHRAPLLPVRGLYEKTTPAFRRKLQDIGARLGMDPNHIAAVMACESGFRPTIQNADSRATGLICFMPSTAKRLGTSVEELHDMTAEEQLDFVEAYYRLFPWHAKLRTATQVYMATFTGDPFKPSDYVIFEYPSIGYRQNKVFDTNADGKIQVWEVGSFPEAVLAAARKRALTMGAQNRDNDEESSGSGAGWALLLVGATLGLAAIGGHRRAA